MWVQLCGAGTHTGAESSNGMALDLYLARAHCRRAVLAVPFNDGQEHLGTPSPDRVRDSDTRSRLSRQRARCSTEDERYVIDVLPARARCDAAAHVAAG